MSYARTTTVQQTASTITPTSLGFAAPGFVIAGRVGEVIVIDWISASVGSASVAVDTEVLLQIEKADGEGLYHYLLYDTWTGGRAGNLFLQFPTGLPLLTPGAVPFEGVTRQAPSTAPQLYISGAPSSTQVSVGYHFEPQVFRVSEH